MSVLAESRSSRSSRLTAQQIRGERIANNRYVTCGVQAFIGCQKKAGPFAQLMTRENHARGAIRGSSRCDVMKIASVKPDGCAAKSQLKSYESLKIIKYDSFAAAIKIYDSEHKCHITI